MSINVHLEIKDKVLIKFQKKKYIDDIISGKLYMNSIKFYQTNGNDEVKDSYEARMPAFGANLKLTDKNGILVKEIDDFDYFDSSYENSFVFCMFSIQSKDNFMTFSDVQKNAIKQLGDNAVIITDYTAFLNRVNMAVEKAGFKHQYANVGYYDDTLETAEGLPIADGSYVLSSLENPLIIPFSKPKRFKHQQEFRILIENYDKKIDHLELEIGDISDISCRTSTDSILTASFSCKEV